MGVVDGGVQFLEEAFSSGADDEGCGGGVVAEDKVDEGGTGQWC